ncbi:hypothetical protein LPJ66_006349, partial [Kickxella alabastrina]
TNTMTESSTETESLTETESSTETETEDTSNIYSETSSDPVYKCSEVTITYARPRIYTGSV